MGGLTVVALGDRPAVFPVVVFVSGVAVGPQVGLPAEFWAALALASACASWWRAPQPGALLALLVSALAGGAAIANLAAHTDGPTLDGRTAHQLEGVVRSATTHAQGTSVEVSVARCDGNPCHLGVLLHTPASAQVRAGQRVAVEARLKPLAEAGNPGEWSRFEALRRRGVVASGGFDGDALVPLSRPSSWSRWLERERQGLASIARAATQAPEAAALFVTLAAGSRAALDPMTEDEFARSGLAHVLSVSGLHVAVLALALMVVLRWLLLRVPHPALRRIDVRRVAAWAALPLAWGYVAFTGMQAPAIRSAIMTSVVLGGLALLRRADALDALAIAAGVMTAIDPAAPFELSVQLSFLAVAALILLAPMLRAVVPVRAFKPTDGALRWALEAGLQSVCASVAVVITTAPVVAAVFQRVSMAGVVSNVIALPLCSALTVLAALGAGVFVVSASAAQPIVWLGVQLSEWLLTLARWFSTQSWAVVDVPSPPSAAVVVWLLALVALALAPRWWKLTALAGPVAATLVLVVAPNRAAAQTEVTFLSVGHGDAIVVSSAGHHALIDGGGVPHGADVGRRVVLPFLKQRGIDQLDLAVLTHPHPDHALGLASTLRELPVWRLWLPAGAQGGGLIDEVIDAADDAEIEAVDVGRATFALGDAVIDVLGPPQDRALLESENDRSIVVRLRHGDVTFLLTGDIEQAAEAQLAFGPATVVKVPHHGSRTSSTATFVERTRPQYAVFSVGRHNRFGFPHDEVVDRYRAVGAKCLRTDLDGAISFHSDGRTVRPRTFLRHAPRAEREVTRRWWALGFDDAPAQSAP